MKHRGMGVAPLLSLSTFRRVLAWQTCMYRCVEKTSLVMDAKSDEERREAMLTATTVCQVPSIRPPWPCGLHLYLHLHFHPTDLRFCLLGCCSSLFPSSS